MDVAEQPSEWAGQTRTLVQLRLHLTASRPSHFPQEPAPAPSRPALGTMPPSSWTVPAPALPSLCKSLRGSALGPLPELGKSGSSGTVGATPRKLHSTLAYAHDPA